MLDWIFSVFILPAFIVFLLYWYGTQPYGVWKRQGVPGPAPTPFIGNISQLFDVKVGARAALGEWIQQYGDIFGLYLFRTPSLVVAEPEAIKQVLVKDFNNFTDRYVMGDGDLQQKLMKKMLFLARGVDWKRIRRIMSPIFSSGKLKHLTHYVNLTARRLGENLKNCAEKEDNTADAKKIFGAFTLDVICGTAFGLDTNSQQNFEGPFIQHAKSLTTFDTSLQLVLGLAGVFPILGKVLNLLGIGTFKNRDVNFFRENLTALMQDRKKHPQKHLDFLQLLMDAEAEDDDEAIGGAKKLTMEEIVAQSIIFIIAGYETTSTTLQFLSYELSKNPDVQSKMAKEIQEVLGDTEEPDSENIHRLKYMEAVIQETLRMYPPAHTLSRQTQNATIINGVQIPAKAAILIPVYNIARDLKFFPNPDTFDPERFFSNNSPDLNPVTFIPFGFGPRVCIGMRLALMEMKIALVHILRNVRVVKASPDVLQLEDFASVLVSKTPIVLHLEPVK